MWEAMTNHTLKFKIEGCDLDHNLRDKDDLHAADKQSAPNDPVIQRLLLIHNICDLVQEKGPLGNFINTEFLA